MSKSIERRQFLKAVIAAAGGLPLLSSLIEKSEALADPPATAPLRLVLLYSGYGGRWDYIRPPTLGTATDVTLNPGMLSFQNSVLAPFAKSPGGKDYTSQMLVIEGLAMTAGLLPYQNVRTHYVGHENTASNCFTGSEVKEQGGTYLPTSQSLDFALGQKFAGSTVRSLQLGIGCDAGATFYDSLSYNGGGQPLPGFSSAYDTFKLLFGTGGGPPPDTAGAARKLKQQQSVVQATKQTAVRLQSRLTGPERAKLDEHIAALADLEARLSPGFTPAACTTPATPAKGAMDMPTATTAYFDLISMALACDRTRFIVADWGVNVNTMPFLFGSTVGSMHDDVAHQVEASADARLNMAKLQNWYASQLAKLMDRLSSIQEGGGTLLDNTLVVWAQDFGESTHGGLNVPYVLLGGKNAKLRMGRYLRVRKSGVDGDWKSYTPNNQLLVSLANAFGLQTNTFGSTEFSGPLPGLV